MHATMPQVQRHLFITFLLLGFLLDAFVMSVSAHAIDDAASEDVDIVDEQQLDARPGDPQNGQPTIIYRQPNQRCSASTAPPTGARRRGKLWDSQKTNSSNRRESGGLGAEGTPNIPGAGSVPNIPGAGDIR